jgi:hypothetical protein
MATAAQIEANRRNSEKSTGPRTEEGKNRSRFNAVDHGCRANILVLPTEQFGEYEKEREAWRLSFRPRNPSEEFLVDRLVSLGWQEKRIDRAQAARLTQRIYHAGIEEADSEREQVIELGQELFRDACGPMALHLEHKIRELCPESGSIRISDYGVDEDQPMRLVIRLQGTGAGCQWMLDQWADLRALLERGVPWLAPDKLKAVRLLGRHPIDAIDSTDVARVYLASFVLLNQGGHPFQEILNDLREDEEPSYETYLKQRHFESLIPKDAAAARLVLLDIVDRATEKLKAKAEMFRQLAELDAAEAAERLSWDDTPDGERLRRYELTVKRMWSRTFDLLLKIRSNADALDIATTASISRSAPIVTIAAIDQPEHAVADVITPSEEPVNEPDPPSEPNSAGENAPNEPNSHAQAPSSMRQDGHKEFRIDTPHLDRKAGGIGTNGEAKTRAVLERVLKGRNSPLLNLTPIFGEH